jgi:hypothetical protein
MPALLITPRAYSLTGRSGFSREQRLRLAAIAKPLLQKRNRL